MRDGQKIFSCWRLTSCKPLPRNIINGLPALHRTRIRGYRSSVAGNVRALENVIERAVLLSKNKQILAGDLPFEKTETQATDNEFYIPPNMTLADIERLVILKTLQRTEGNKQARRFSAGDIQTSAL